MIFDLILIIVFGVIMAKRIKSNNKKNTNEIGLNDKKLEEILFPKSGEKNKDISIYSFINIIFLILHKLKVQCIDYLPYLLHHFLLSRK